MTDEETIIDENAEDNISDDSSNDTSDALKETLKKRLELELGLPLTPQLGKHVEQSFDGNIILIEDFPIVEQKV